MCREFAASPIATREELEEHLRAALALERLRGEERRERASGRPAYGCFLRRTSGKMPLRICWSQSKSSGLLTSRPTTLFAMRTWSPS